MHSVIWVALTTERNAMIKALGYATHYSFSRLKLFEFERE